jgi:hypothetical protein
LGLSYGNQRGNLAGCFCLALLVVHGFFGYFAPALDGRGRWPKVNACIPVDALGFETSVVNASAVASTLKSDIGHAGE